VELINVLKAISDDTRYKLVNLLLKHDLCVGALATRLNVSESAVSQHLKILRDSGIVKGDKRGYFTHYYVDRQVLRQVAEEITQLSQVTLLNQDCIYHCSKKENTCNKKEVNQHES